MSDSHLEQEGERKVAELINKNAVTEEALMGIIDAGNDEFKRVHGRNMTCMLSSLFSHFE